MSLQQPTFYTPATAYFQGLAGPAASIVIPWVTSFDQVPHGMTLCVLTVNLNSVVAAGLYVLMPVSTGQGSIVQWQLGLTFSDVSTISSTQQTLTVVLNSTTTQSYGSGYSVWLNGNLQGTAQVNPSATGIWVVTHTPATQSGGITALSQASDYVTAPLATSNLSISNALATKMTAVGIFASTGALQSAFPAASNTGSTALVGSGAPYTQYVSNGSAWTAAGVGSGNVTNVGTFANTSALQTAFPAASNAGNLALIGSSAPYSAYNSNGSAWVASSGGASISNATPQPLGAAVAGSTGTASDAGHVHALPTARQVGALALPSGTWNGATNTAYDVHGTSLGALTSGVAPPADISFTVVGCPTLTTVAISSAFTQTINGDVIYFDSVNYQKIAGSNIGVVTSAILKGDGSGGAAVAVAGQDYALGALLICNVAVVLPPDGSVGANGALTVTSITNLVGGYYSGWFYFPANVLNGSNVAGLYWTVMTSSTGGTVYNTMYTPGTNSGAGSWHIPVSPTPFSGTTGTAFTTGTAAITVSSVTVPGNLMGPNGELTTTVFHRNNNSAGSKNVGQKFAGTTAGYSVAATTNINNYDSSTIWNKGVTNAQISLFQGQPIHSGLTGQSVGADTTQPQPLITTLAKAVGSDWMVLDSIKVTVTPGA